MSRYDIRPLDSAADTAGFDCGDVSLNDYLKRYATQDVKRGVARTFIASPEDALVRIAGFFTLSAADFYRHFSFIELPGQAQRLILPYRYFAK